MTKEDETKPRRTPQSLVTEDGVKKALEAKYGLDAVLESWEVKDFTSKGDNYACIVSSVKVHYKKDGDQRNTSFVVKLNPCMALEGMENSTNLMFEKEGKFYSTIVPKINKVFRSIKQPDLKVPGFYHMDLTMDNEVLYLEDLRESEFKMADRKEGLDVPHLLLLLKELSRLHAASLLLKGSESKEDLIKKDPCLREMFTSEEMINNEDMVNWCNSSLKTSAKVLCGLDGYSDAAEKISKIENTLIEMKKEVENIDQPFEVFCHGDCWTNNFLFK